MVEGRNLIVFSYDFPPSQGGIARLTWQIAKGLSPFYNSVTILTRSKDGKMIPSESINANIEYLPSKRGKCEWAAYKYLKRINNKEHYTIICGLWHPEAAISIFAGMPYVFCLAHGGEFITKGSYLRKKIWLPKYAQYILKRSSGVIANSNFTKQKVLAIASNANVIALPLGVDSSRFYPLYMHREKETSTLKIATVSRIQPHKGHLYVLEALEALPDNQKFQIEWHIAGDGAYRNLLQLKVEETSLKDKVTFHGFVKEESLNDFYNKTDLFILCSREIENSHNIEGFGLVFLEAQAAGLPVIGTYSGGIPDAIEKGNGGWLVSTDDVSEVTKLIGKIINNRDELEKQAILARERVLKDCTWEQYCRQLHQILTNRA